MRTEEGHNQMRRILHCIAYIYPEIGYCQGMNFIAGSLVTIVQDEANAFYLFWALLNQYDMVNLYKPGVPELHYKNYQMGQVIKDHMPRLYNHL